MSSEPFGMSYEDWTIKFWQWLISIPADRSPVTDETGERAGVAQIGQPIFNLVFSSKGEVQREYTVPAGQHILIPVNVVETSFTEFPGAKDDDDLRKLAKEDESSNPFVFLSVDGKKFNELESTDGNQLADLKEFRVHSRPFDVTFPDNPIFGFPGRSRAVSDGFWVILEALTIGTHHINFAARLTNPITDRLFYSDNVKYTIHVLEDKTEGLSA
jgi:hypothetical protein